MESKAQNAHAAGTDRNMGATWGRPPTSGLTWMNPGLVPVGSSRTDGAGRATQLWHQPSFCNVTGLGFAENHVAMAH
eukprot:8559045-Alexandrium_andersonii.AAC.1